MKIHCLNGDTFTIGIPNSKGEYVTNMHIAIPTGEQYLVIITSYGSTIRFDVVLDKESIANATFYNPEVAYWVEEPYRKLGIMSSLLKQIIIPYVRTISRKPYITATTDKRNIASQKTLTKAGFLLYSEDAWYRFRYAFDAGRGCTEGV